MSIYEFLKSLKAGTNDETNGRHIIPAELVRLGFNTISPRILDVGAGYGADIINARTRLNEAGRDASLFAVESFPSAITHLSKLDVTVVSADIERDRLPFDDGFFDVVVCNQVFEHLKEIFWITSEICRVLKSGGALMLGVPNLGSLHNRLALLVGHQPPAIHVFGPHVRGFTTHGLTGFLEMGGGLKVKRIVGGNFYPFPPLVSRPLSRLLPSFSVSSFYILERVGKENFLNVFSTPAAGALVDTPYYRGPDVQTTSA
jgi:SAM-dependent methyltransferase